MALVYYALALIATIILFEHFRSASKSLSIQSSFPKGPKTLPILGNLHQIPLHKSFLTFKIWSRSASTSTLDGLVGLRLGPSARAVVLHKWTHIRDLFDSRDKGAIYSDRPYFPMADYVIPNPPGTDLHLVFARYGSKWRRARKTIVGFLSDKQLDKMLGVQDAESTQMMWEFLQFCGGNDKASLVAYHRYVLRSFGGVVLATVFGLRGKDSDEGSRVMRFFSVMDEWARMVSPGATPPIDVFPWLQNVPDFMTPWKNWRKSADSLKNIQSSSYRALFSEAEMMVKAGKAEESFVARLIKDKDATIQAGREQDAYTQLELDYICGFLMEGGADTTAMTFETFILAMASHPEIQKQVQKEVDTVFGADVMPHEVNGGDLPFLKACFLETLRWRPPFPMAIPHANTADDVYQGYSIPKGTTIIPNIWAICQDPEEFDDPDSYNPGRYLANPFGIITEGTNLHNKSDEADLNVAVGDATKLSSSGRRHTYAFGAGRRVCAGSKMAEDSLLMAMSKLLWSFNVIPGSDKKLDTDYSTAFKDSILTGPKLFSVKFVLRDEQKRAIINKEWKKADEFLSRFG